VGLFSRLEPFFPLGALSTPETQDPQVNKILLLSRMSPRVLRTRHWTLRTGCALDVDDAGQRTRQASRKRTLILVERSAIESVYEENSESKPSLAFPVWTGEVLETWFCRKKHVCVCVCV